MEGRIGVNLVKKQVGGKGGGGTALTEEGKALVDKFNKLLAGTQETINISFEEIF